MTTEPLLTTETPTTTPPTTAPTTAPDWNTIKGALSEELRNDPSMAPITSLEGLTKSFIHAQKAIGRDKYAVPDKHATPEDWKGVFTKLGNPEKIEDYKVSLEESNLNEDVFNKVKAVAHEKGILPWQFEAIVKGFNDEAKRLSESQETAYKADMETKIGKLKSEWGKEFDNQIKKANVAMRHLIPNVEDQQAFIDAGFGGNPAALKLLANAAKLFKDDVFLGQGEGTLGGITPQDALVKARAIQGDNNHPYRNPAHPNHKAAKEEVQNLYKLAFPE